MICPLLGLQRSLQAQHRRQSAAATRYRCRYSIRLHSSSQLPSGIASFLNSATAPIIKNEPLERVLPLMRELISTEEYRRENTFGRRRPSHSMVARRSIAKLELLTFRSR